MQRNGTKNSSLPQQLTIRAVKQRERPDARPYSAEERRISQLFCTPGSLRLSNQNHSPSVWLLCRITAIFPKDSGQDCPKKKKTKHCSTFIHVPVHALMILSSNGSNGRFSVERETPRRAKGSGVVNNVLGTLTQSVSRGGQKYMKKRSFGT